MQIPQNGKDIIKLESRIEVLPNGSKRTIYRKVVFKRDHPDYPKEFNLMVEFFQSQQKQDMRKCLST